MGNESVKRAIVAALAQPEASIVIQHPPGQEATLQAEELRSWFGALAIDPRRVTLRSNLPAGAQMRIEAIP